MIRISNSLLEDRLQLNEKKGDEFKLVSDNFEELIPGKWHKRFWIDVEKGILTNYKKIKIDSILNNDGKPAGEYLYRVYEENYTLLSSNKIAENKVSISGQIKNSLNKKIHFRFLSDPFGIRMEKATVFMDEQGKFQKDLKFEHGGFIFATIEFPSRSRGSA